MENNNVNQVQQEEKQQYVWLTIPKCCNVEAIKVNPKSSHSAYPKDMQKTIWFPDNDEGHEMADKLLKAIKQTIYKHYHEFQKKHNTPDNMWLTKEWVNRKTNW